MKVYVLLLCLLVACQIDSTKENNVIVDETNMTANSVVVENNVISDSAVKDNISTDSAENTVTVAAVKNDITANSVEVKSMNTFVELETSMGKMKIKLYDDKAPLTSKNFKDLVQKGYYDGIIFHRVIKNFMIQGGDPTGTGMGGPGYEIKDEFGPGLKHSKKGILSMANSGPNTGGSQFFITLVPTPWLDGKHAIFGEVTEGLDVLDKIGTTPTGANDKPKTEVKIIKATIVK